MCYPKPGPRCSNHTKEALVKAVSNYKDNPDNELARSTINEARKEFYGSTAGIEYLRRKADHHDEDGHKGTAELYRKDADYYEKTRKEALTKYNRVKDLPAERREWSYDEDGYADEDDHGYWTALSKIHTGSGEDYLVKNNLTDIHGWAAYDYDGDDVEELWVGTDEGSVTRLDLRRVELYNIKEGMENERREIYRLNDGDAKYEDEERYSTFGSYKEAAASKTVITSEQAHTIMNDTKRLKEEVDKVMEETHRIMEEDNTE